MDAGADALVRGAAADVPIHGVVDVAVARDGSLLVTDDGGDAIWRVTYKGE